MSVRALFLLLATGLLSGCLGDDAAERLPDSGGAIPSRSMVVPVRVQAAHNGDTLFLRLRFPAAPGDRRHETWRRLDGAWRREGGGFRDLAAALDQDGERGDLARTSAASETQLSVMIDDPQSAGRLLYFGTTGCVGQCHDRQRQMPNWRAADGPQPMTIWTGFGKADLWIWRAQRSALAGFADDLSFTPSGYLPDAGNAPFAPVALGTAGIPAWLFAGDFAQPWADPPPALAFDDGTVDGVPDAMSLGSALLLGYVPADGDTVPAQRLSTPTGSRADVDALAVESDGEWDLLLTRKLSTGDATGDLALATGRSYGIGLALHRDDADGRDHYVSFPLTLMLDTAGEGVFAPAITGTGDTAPSFSDETAFPVTDVPLFLPGVTSFDFTVGASVRRDGYARTVDVIHGGAVEVGNAEYRCNDCHTVQSTDPSPPVTDAGPMERLVLRRGGVYGPTPFFEDAP